MLYGPKMAKNGQKSCYIKAHFFGKTSSPIWAKMAQMMVRDPMKMSYKPGLTHPSKIFHGSKIEIFGPSQSSAGVKGAMDQM